MRRPAAARKALGLSPLVQAGGADASRLERVPLMAALTRPEIVFAWRPAAERAPDTRAGRIMALLLIEVAIQNHGRFGSVIREGAHASIL